MYNRVSRLFSWSLLLVIVLTACSGGTPVPTATSTPVPTDTPLPTATPVPTNTPLPTPTPNVEATQQAEAFQSVLDRFHKEGFISTTEGEAQHLKSFKDEFAKLHDYLKWGWPSDAKDEYSNFVLSAHFEWGSYSSTPDVSGCGIGFGIKENGDHYVIVLDREHLVLIRAKGSRLLLMGTAGGDRYPTIPIPAKADFAIAVSETTLAVIVDEYMVNYILSSDQSGQGKIAYSLLSGTNSGYGTRCEMTNIQLWTPK